MILPLRVRDFFATSLVHGRIFPTFPSVPDRKSGIPIPFRLGRKVKFQFLVPLRAEKLISERLCFWFNHFRPKSKKLYEEIKHKRNMFLKKQTKFLQLNSFRIQRSLKLLLHYGHACHHLLALSMLWNRHIWSKIKKLQDENIRLSMIFPMKPIRDS